MFCSGANGGGNALLLQYEDRTQPMDNHVLTMLSKRELTTAPMAAQMFGNAGREHMEKYGELILVNYELIKRLIPEKLK